MKRLVVFLVLLASMLSIKAAEMYVVKSTDGSTLTFYYDDLKSSREGTVYGIDEWRNLRFNYSMKEDITSAVFDASFKNARPTDTSYLFCYLTSLESIENLQYLNTSEVTDMKYMFYGCGSLQDLCLSHFDTRNVTNMESMFSGCSSLSELDLSSFDTHKVTDMSNMFSGCIKIQLIAISGFNTSNVTDMQGMFCDCFIIEILDVSSFDTRNVTDMSFMFCNCQYLQDFYLKSFDTSKVKDMSLMFSGCYSLTSLDLSSFNTGNVTNMMQMFDHCSDLLSLDLSNFDTKNVKSMSWMFLQCSRLNSVDVSSFNTRNVKSMSGMFSECSRLKNLDLSSFDTSNVTDMSYMFSHCSNLTSLDISNYNISNVQNISGMCGDVASAQNPCLLKVPEGFDFREEIDFSGDYFMWQGGYFRLPSDELKVEPVTVLKGSPSTMSIELKNPSSEKYIGYQFKIVLPEGVSICKKDNGQYSYTQGNRYGNTQMMMNIREQNDGSYMVLCFRRQPGRRQL